MTFPFCTRRILCHPSTAIHQTYSWRRQGSVHVVYINTRSSTIYGHNTDLRYMYKAMTYVQMRACEERCKGNLQRMELHCTEYPWKMVSELLKTLKPYRFWTLMHAPFLTTWRLYIIYHTYTLTFLGWVWRRLGLIDCWQTDVIIHRRLHSIEEQ